MESLFQCAATHASQSIVSHIVLFFEKLYANDVKDYMDHRYNITSFFPDGDVNKITGQPTWGSNKGRDDLNKEVKQEPFTGIIVKKLTKLEKDLRMNKCHWLITITWEQ